ncbi:MAG: glucokinase, partial [Thermodesulfobacteriota bacterium]
GERPGPDITAAAFGVAGVVEGNRCELLNIDLVVDGASVGERFSIDKVALINDLEATGYSLPLLAKTDIELLQAGIKKPGNAAVIAAGTGLGESILFFDGERHIPSHSEGGHTDFAPQGAEQIDLLDFLSARYGHVSYERVLSGEGLGNIYDFFEAAKAQSPKRVTKSLCGIERSRVIVSEALSSTNETSKKALDLFISIYGAEAGNLALKAMATAGVYIGGGIAAGLAGKLKSGIFMDCFINKGRYEKFLKTIPVYAILNEEAPFIGAAVYAARLI